MLDLDPPEHTRLRQLVNRGFTPKVIRSMDGHFPDVSRQDHRRSSRQRQLRLRHRDRCRAAADRDRRAVRCAQRRSAQGPVQVVEHDGRLRTTRSTHDPAPTWPPAAMTELYMYANELAAARKIEPKQDIITTAARSRRRSAAHRARVRYVRPAAPVAGNETTRTPPRRVMLPSWSTPTSGTLLKSDPAKYLDGPRSRKCCALRHTRDELPPHRHERHRAARPDHRRGRRGRDVLYISADRDPDFVHQPRQVRHRSAPNPHLAFGGGGPHHCLGVSLARLEMRIMFELLLEQVDHF